MTCKYQQLDSEGKRLTMLDIRETTDEMIDDIFFFSFSFVLDVVNRKRRGFPVTQLFR